MKAQMERSIVMFGALLLLAACSDKTTSGPIAGAGSSVTSVNIGLPDRGSLKTQVADIETKMNAFQLVITPVDATCVGATSVNQVSDYAATTSVNASLKQGCDYDVTLMLGQKSVAAQPTQPSNLVTYNSQVKAIIDVNCAASCHKMGGTMQQVDLSSYAGAQRYSARIQARVADGTMPSRGLAAADRATIKSWVDGGSLEKDASSAGSSSSTGAPTGALAATYYKNNTPLRIAKADIAGKSSFAADLRVQLQEAGRLIGLTQVAAPSGGGSIPNNGASNGSINPPVQPLPAQPAVSIPAGRDFDLVDADGKSAKLSSLFKGKYMLLDFSASNCGYCIQRAGEMEQNTALQQQLDGNKCGHATFVPKGDLTDWFDATGGKSNFTGKHSYELTTARIGTIAEAFEINFIGTPTFILIDATGRMIANDNGVPTDAVAQYCR